MDVVALGLAKAEMRRGYEPLLTEPLGDPRALGPTFDAPGTQILTQAASGLATIYWPWIYRVGDKIDGALGEFYLDFSTDHDTGAGGVKTMYADHPAGPWTLRAGTYLDSVGTQTETPTVIWNPETSLFHRYYQVKEPGQGQYTVVATSPDALTWTRVGRITQMPTTVAGRGAVHTGYFTCYRYGGLWVGHSLSGGNYHTAMWFSRDGLDWTLDPRQIVADVDITGNNDLRLNWAARAFVWRGQLLNALSITNFSSGEETNVGNAYTARLAPDLRSLASPPYPTGLPQISSMVRHNGKLWAVYRNGDATSSFYVAEEV